MTKKLLPLHSWEPVFRSLVLVATGAYLLGWYLIARDEQPAALQVVFDGIRLIWVILFGAWVATMPRRKKGIEDPGPAISGTAVVLVCGLGAAIFLAQDASWPTGFILPGVIVIVTVGVAAVVHRFASKHANEIGEARFSTGKRHL